MRAHGKDRRRESHLTQWLRTPDAFGAFTCQACECVTHYDPKDGLPMACGSCGTVRPVDTTEAGPAEFARKKLKTEDMEKTSRAGKEARRKAGQLVGFIGKSPSPPKDTHGVGIKPASNRKSRHVHRKH